MRPDLRFVILLAALACLSSNAIAQTPPKKPAPLFARWVEVQNATLNARYRFVDTSTGTVTTNQVQHRESLRAKFKFDRSGNYGLNLGVFSGSRFTSSWNNTGIGLGDWQGPLAFRALFFSAMPFAGIEGQYGSLFIVKGQSTEITTYDDDGYVIGERITIARPRQLFLDEITATFGYFTSDPREYAVSKRTKYLNDTPNYKHFLISKLAGRRGGVSADYTSLDTERTWRAAGRVRIPELRAIDSVLVEGYKRTERSPDSGFAVTLDKVLNRVVSLNGGYASIDPLYGGLNADRFNIGNRLFAMSTFTLSPRFTTSAFITTAVGNNVPLPQRTLLNLVFTYNALPDLRRTGLF